MVNGIIYCAISPSNKKYYDYSSLKFEERKTKHRYSFLKGRKCSFYSAIQKYGWENIKENMNKSKIGIPRTEKTKNKIKEAWENGAYDNRRKEK
jgi:bisphosphoglycerate-dependent phosphoglycerate mutase